MKLISYLDGRRGEAARLGRVLKINPARISQMAYEVRPVDPTYVPALVRETGGSVRQWDLRPADWHLIWPELINDPAAPPIPDISGAGAAALGQIAHKEVA